MDVPVAPPNVPSLLPSAGATNTDSPTVVSGDVHPCALQQIGSKDEPNELSEQVESNPKVAGSMTTETGPVEARVLAGFLPGLDAYTGSSSDSSSDSSTDVEDSAQTLDVIAVTRTKSASSGGE
nr:unnamed protein product [Spirometra erinaceieuropaei]